MPGGLAPKRKGAKWERELAEIFRNRSGIKDIKRGIGQARSGHEVADVEGVPRFWIEAKHGVNTTPKRALRQAERALAASGIKGKVPISVCKDDRERPTVTMYLDDFLDLAYPDMPKERMDPEKFVIEFLEDKKGEPAAPQEMFDECQKYGLTKEEVKTAYLELFDKGKVSIDNWKLTLVK